MNILLPKTNVNSAKTIAPSNFTFLFLVATCLSVFTGCSFSPPYAGDVSFSNYSGQQIWVDKVFYDGKQLPAPVGILCGGGGGKASMDMLPYPLPKKFTLYYQKDGKNIQEEIDTSSVEKYFPKGSSARRDYTLNFIYTSQGKFILKVEFRKDLGGHFSESYLYPDEENPLFLKYKELCKAAGEGDAFKVKRHLAERTPYYWNENPIGLSPLEMSVRWGKKDAFLVLIENITENYPDRPFVNCLKLAAQDNYDDILAVLLENPRSSKVTKEDIGNILYAACTHGKSVSTMQMILDHYKLDVNFKTSDYGHTLLYTAVLDDNLDFARWLIGKGADVNAKLKTGVSPISQARSAEMKKLLSEAMLKQGAVDNSEKK